MRFATATVILHRNSGVLRNTCGQLQQRLDDLCRSVQLVEYSIKLCGAQVQTPLLLDHLSGTVTGGIQHERAQSLVLEIGRVAQVRVNLGVNCREALRHAEPQEAR